MAKIKLTAQEKLQLVLESLKDDVKTSEVFAGNTILAKHNLIDSKKRLYRQL